MGYKKFLFIFLGILFGFVSMIAGLLVYLNRIYEHNSYDEIVQYQIENNSIYGSALNENYFKYRLAMVKKIKPEVLVIGSSRAGQFRKKFFNTSFLTTANGANTLREMEYFTNEVLKIYHPKLIIFVVDPWDFNPRYQNYQIAKYQELSGTDIGFEKIFLSLKYIIDGKMPFINIFDNNLYINPTTGYPSMGIRSITLGDGSFSDGSYLYASTVFNTNNKKDLNFRGVFDLIQNNIYFFSWSRHVDNQRILDFQEMVKNVSREQIEVLSIVVPLPWTVYQKVMPEKNTKYAYLKELQDDLKGMYFFLNPKTIGTSDCEFLDGFHPGDVAIARVLKTIGEEDKNFAKYLNMQEINLTIKNYAGNAYSGPRPAGIKEIDFLGLGCKKK